MFPVRCCVLGGTEVETRILAAAEARAKAAAVAQVNAILANIQKTADEKRAADLKAQVDAAPEIVRTMTLPNGTQHAVWRYYVSGKDANTPVFVEAATDAKDIRKIKTTYTNAQSAYDAWYGDIIQKEATKMHDEEIIAKGKAVYEQSVKKSSNTFGLVSAGVAAAILAAGASR